MSQERNDRLGRVKPSHVRELLKQTEQALQKYPGDMSLSWFKATCLLDLKQLDEAEDVFRQMLAQTSSSAWRGEVRKKLAEVQWRKGDYLAAWQLLPKKEIVEWLAKVFLPFLVLVGFAALARRWVGVWVLPQAIAMLLLYLWNVVAAYLLAWLTFGVPLPSAEGNTNSYQLLTEAGFWLGLAAIATFYRRRYVQGDTTPMWQPPRWLLALALTLYAGMLLDQAYWLHMVVVHTDVPRVLRHITVQSVIFLTAGIPIAAAIFTWWFIGTVYTQARERLHHMELPGVAVAVGWTVLLVLTFLTAGGAMSISSMLSSAIIVLACVTTYETWRRLWVPSLLFAAYYYVPFVNRLMTAVGNLT
ncbi:MAG: tetratricopeptide repeat protein [Firmicutes bacterium]|nr:tetratricopeptide repeat protein [Bacillota bacterium]